MIPSITSGGIGEETSETQSQPPPPPLPPKP